MMACSSASESTCSRSDAFIALIPGLERQPLDWAIDTPKRRVPFALYVGQIVLVLTSRGRRRRA